MKYLHTMVRVTDLNDSLRFYSEAIGLEIVRRRDSEKGRYTLAQVWLGESGISDASPSSAHDHERLCNAMAAELLVPTEKFVELWDSIKDSDEAKITLVRAHIKVSALVIARRALELGKVGATAASRARESRKSPNHGRG